MSGATASGWSVCICRKRGETQICQLQENLASLDLELSAEQLKSLDGASRIELGFPQSIYGREMVRSIRYGGTWDRLLL